MRQILIRVLFVALMVFSVASIAQTGTRADEVVELPPLVVGEKVDPLKWTYLALPEMEVISVCSEDATRGLVHRYLRLDELLLLLVPRHFQADASVRGTCILFNDEIGRIKGQEVMAEIIGSGKRIRFAANLRLWDVDAHALFIVMPKNVTPFDSMATLHFTRERVTAQLESRAPTLPPWFIAGTLGLYSTANFREESVTVNRADWLSTEEGEALRRDSSRPRTLLAMEELLTRPRRVAEDDPDELAQLWRAQCALFVRWAVAHEHGARKEALWKFAERSVHEPVTETLFRECFGLGFSDVRDRLSDYLPLALNEKIELKPAKLSRLPRLRPRPATPAEVARIRGDWERMQIAHVRARYPQAAPKYVEQALRTLRRAYDAGERDRDLLAVLGLAELDGGNPVAAEPFLVAATRAGVTRTRAWFELGKLRHARARERANAADGKLTVDEAAEVLALLENARRQKSPVADVYALMAEVWIHSGIEPTRAHLAMLAEGARLFPRKSALVMAAIHFHARAGLIEPTETLVALGLRYASDAAMREKFARLAEVAQGGRK
jgi:hypothetical protein